MKSNILRRVNEANPAAQGAAAARQDDRARRNKKEPFGYYAKEFYDLETVRQSLIDLRFSHDDMNFHKAAVFVEKAQIAMLKAGR